MKKIFKTSLLVIASLFLFSCAPNVDLSSNSNSNINTGNQVCTINGVESKLLEFNPKDENIKTPYKDELNVYHIDSKKTYIFEVNILFGGGSIPIIGISKDTFQMLYNQENIVLDPFSENFLDDDKQTLSVDLHYYLRLKNDVTNDKITIILKDEFLSVTKFTTKEILVQNNELNITQVMFKDIVLSLNADDKKYISDTLSNIKWLELEKVIQKEGPYGIIFASENGINYDFEIDFGKQMIYRQLREYSSNNIVAYTLLDDDIAGKILNIFSNEYSKITNKKIPLPTLLPDLKKIDKSHIEKIRLRKTNYSLGPGNIYNIYYSTSKTIIDSFVLSLFGNVSQVSSNDFIAPGNIVSIYTVFLSNREMEFVFYDNVIVINDKAYQLEIPLPNFDKEENVLGFTFFDGKYDIYDEDNLFIKTLYNLEDYEFIKDSDQSIQSKKASGYLKTSFGEITIIDNFKFMFRNNIFKLARNLTFAYLLNV